MEPFNLAVGLGSVRAGAFVGDPGVGQGLAPRAGAVAGAVVGQDALDGDPGGLEERLGAGPERGGGVFGLVGQDFGVGQAGVVVDRGVQAAVPDGRGTGGGTGVGVSGLVAFAAGSAGGPVATAVRDVAQFLDVDVDQFARGGLHVAADRGAGGPIQPGQSGHRGAGQDLVHGGRDQVQSPGDTDRPPPLLDS
jgi:hypothetical protein